MRTIALLLFWLAASASAQDGEFTERRPDGKLLRRGHRVHGMLEGPLYKYDGAGKLAEKVDYSDDRPDYQGEHVFYYPNGKPREIQRYKDGVLEGEREELGDEGQRTFIETYSLGQRNGPYKRFHPNGKVFEEGAYEEDEPVGLYRKRDEEGRLREEGRYVKGRLEGVYKIYSASGKPSEVIPYSRGAKEGEASAFYENGQMQSKRKYKAGKLEGESRFYRADGALLCRVTYHEDDREGPMQCYYPGGELAIDLSYEQGNPARGRFLSPEGKVLERHESLDEWLVQIP